MAGVTSAAAACAASATVPAPPARAGSGARLVTNCCYLLRSLHPRWPQSTYIGFTNDPARRIRQHNGEITNGARRTSKKRPWCMVAVVHGFPSKVAALQFEWAWQHPDDRKLVRRELGPQRNKWGPRHKLALMHAMLSLPPWNVWPLSVHYTDPELMLWGDLRQPLPPHMREARTLGQLSSMAMYTLAAAIVTARKAAAAKQRGDGKRRRVERDDGGSAEKEGQAMVGRATDEGPPCCWSMPPSPSSEDGGGGIAGWDVVVVVDEDEDGLAEELSDDDGDDDGGGGGEDGPTPLPSNGAGHATGGLDAGRGHGWEQLGEEEEEASLLALVAELNETRRQSLGGGAPPARRRASVDAMDGVMDDVDVCIDGDEGGAGAEGEGGVCLRGSPLPIHLDLRPLAERLGVAFTAHAPNGTVPVARSASVTALAGTTTACQPPMSCSQPMPHDTRHTHTSAATSLPAIRFSQPVIATGSGGGGGGGPMPPRHPVPGRWVRGLPAPGPHVLPPPPAPLGAPIARGVPVGTCTVCHHGTGNWPGQLAVLCSACHALIHLRCLAVSALARDDEAARRRAREREASLVEACKPGAASKGKGEGVGVKRPWQPGWMTKQGPSPSMVALASHGVHPQPTNLTLPCPGVTSDGVACTSTFCWPTVVARMRKQLARGALAARLLTVCGEQVGGGGVEEGGDETPVG